MHQPTVAVQAVSRMTLMRWEMSQHIFDVDFVIGGTGKQRRINGIIASTEMNKSPYGFKATGISRRIIRMRESKLGTTAGILVLTRTRTRAKPSPPQILIRHEGV
jgi:hypothetical protein